MLEKNLWKHLKAAARDKAEVIYGINDYIFHHPELGLKEYESVAYLTEVLKNHGFAVTCPYGGTETAFRAEMVRGEGPVIAFLAEYDALPGYGPEKTPAHACGHNWIAASSLGAAILLSQIQGWKGSVVVIGTPAEETLGGKILLAEENAFDGLDAVYEMHLYPYNSLTPRALAIDPWEFSFQGKASHASSAPEKGINALDAVNLTFAGINALRQQLRSDVRIHGIVSEGGMAPNIIPERAACRFYVRSSQRSYLDEVCERVKNCARGAALMTGAELTISKFENSFDDLLLNGVMTENMAGYLEDVDFGAMNHERENGGSTDLGTVSYLAPTFYGFAGVGDGTVGCHEEGFVQLANSPQAQKKALQAALAMAGSGAELLTDPQLMARVKEEWGAQIAESNFQTRSGRSEKYREDVEERIYDRDDKNNGF